MRFAQVLLAVAGVLCLLAAGAQAASIPIGSSSLISHLDYSDTFTTLENGGLADRPLGAYGPAFAVESTYGNPAQNWPALDFSIADDANNVYNDWYPTSPTPYVGSGGGSATGMTQTGALALDTGFGYGLRDRFVIQCDAMTSSNDRTGLSFGTLNLAAEHPTQICSLGNPDTCSVFIRHAGSTVGSGEVAIWHSSLGEVDTGLSSPITSGSQWNNYALLVDLTARTVEVFVDESSIGVIDVDTVAGGALNGVALSNQAVMFSAADGDYLHFIDNVQVGAVPEPGMLTLLLGALVAMLAIRRK